MQSSPVQQLGPVFQGPVNWFSCFECEQMFKTVRRFEGTVKEFRKVAAAHTESLGEQPVGIS